MEQKEKKGKTNKKGKNIFSLFFFKLKYTLMELLATQEIESRKIKTTIQWLAI